ncbi:5359_t:CDS:1, partial [Cetraspora pellucida]
MLNKFTDDINKLLKKINALQSAQGTHSEITTPSLLGSFNLYVKLNFEMTKERAEAPIKFLLSP